MDVSFPRCYPSLSPSQDLDAHPAVRSDATKELPGLATPAQRFKHLLCAGSLKDRGPRGNSSKGKRCPLGLSPLSLQEETAASEVSEWYQHPVQVPAQADPAALRSLQAVLSCVACAEP